jgi:hypothetical protein
MFSRTVRITRITQLLTTVFGVLTRPVSLRKVNRLTVFRNRVLRGIFVSNREDLTGG